MANEENPLKTTEISHDTPTLTEENRNAQSTVKIDAVLPGDTVTEPAMVTPKLHDPLSLVGQKINGRYEVLSVLGKGGIGITYHAIDTRVHSRGVVIKLLLDSSSENEWLVRKFQHESEALARIDHPGVVKVYEVDNLPNGKPFFVMEYVKGRTLLSLMKAGPLELSAVAKIIRQAGEALNAAHDEGVIHRDLKPDNIMLQTLSGGAEQVKLIDFGVAKVADPRSAEATQAAMITGTPPYMAAEQIQEGVASVASDIYALGVIAYEMLTGRRPFAVDWSSHSWPFQSVNMQRAGVRVKPRTLRPELSEVAESIILKALAFNPANRYNRADAFGEQLAIAMSSQAKPIAPTITLPDPVPTFKDPAQHLFDQLWVKAKFTDRVWPVAAEEIEQPGRPTYRGLGGSQKKIQYEYKLGSRLRIAVDLDREGYLTLLDAGTEGVIYCLCPSRFAPETSLQRGVNYLPQARLEYDAFELSGQLGEERLLVIVSDEPLGLDWLPTDRSVPARGLNQSDIEALLASLETIGVDRWLAFSTYFKVID